jgi:hypothetical protein
MSKIIFVTGLHRSGTTFFGKFLTSFDNTYYIHEPMNPSNKINHLGIIQKFYWKLPNKNDQNMKRFIKIKKYIYPFEKNLKYSSTIREIIKSFYYLFLTNIAKIKSSKIIVKDPFVLFYVSKLKKEIFQKKSEIIILIRDPFNFIASCSKRNWDFDFNNFLNQRNKLNFFSNREILLMKKIKNFDTISKLSFLWKIFFFKIYELKKINKNVNLVFYNNFIKNEKKNAKLIAKKLNLKFSKNNIDFLNSLKRNNQNKKASNIFRKNSKNDLNNYKKILSKKEINIVNKICKKEFFTLKKIFKKKAII